MSVNPFFKFKRLSELVTLNSLRRPQVVLNPKGDYIFNSNINNMSVVLDKADWKIPERVQETVKRISEDTNLTGEQKILKLFETLSISYTYDDNLLSYIHKIEDDKFVLPDWYGRDPDQEWEQNRESHNRRVCYEISRYLAKSLEEIFKDQPDYGVCIFWDEDLTHYFVGLTSNDYDLSLDLDNFENIKDLTRVKTGLTIDGIKILEDRSGKFTSALNYFNQGRKKYATKAISSDIRSASVSTQNGDMMDTFDDDATFFASAVQILREKYDIDSEGMFEYMKEIVDIRLGSKAREKIWKKIENGKPDADSKYIRCLLLNIQNPETSEMEKFLIDVDRRKFERFYEDEFQKEEPTFIHFKELNRNWDEHYNGK